MDPLVEGQVPLAEEGLVALLTGCGPLARVASAVRLELGLPAGDEGAVVHVAEEDHLREGTCFDGAGDGWTFIRKLGQTI